MYGVHRVMEQPLKFFLKAANLSKKLHIDVWQGPEYISDYYVNTSMIAIHGVLVLGNMLVKLCM